MTRKVALGGVLAALAVVLNHALATVPNLELTSFTLFLAGWLLGPGMGAATAAAAACAFSLLNPVGMPGTFLLAAQVLGYATWGLLGGLLAEVRPLPGPYQLVTVGVLGTAWFQLLVNSAIWLPSGLPAMAIFGPALPFALPHLGCNALVFPLLLPLMHPHLEGFRRRLVA